MIKHIVMFKLKENAEEMCIRDRCYNGWGDFMAYFLKKSNLKKGTYLQIYESFYDPRKKNVSR